MEDLNYTFDQILTAKATEIKNILETKAKTKKLTSSSLDCSYDVKTTLYKINAEQERKIKASKQHKKKEGLFTD